MATKSEVVGNGFAGAIMARTALTELIKLGHEDRMEALEKKALKSIEESIRRISEPDIDKEAALKAATQELTGMIMMAKAAAAAENAIGLR